MNYKIEVLPKYNNPIFEQRESGTTHTPFELEYVLYNAIKDGNTKAMLSAMNKYFEQGFVIGRMSMNELRQTKYWAISVIAIAIHYSILGGLDETDAYNLSDEYIQSIDKFSSMEECIDYLKEKAVELTNEVKKAKKKNALSPKIRKCVHYIHIHLHEKITINMLSDYAGLSKDYLSVLFKKEIGQSVHSYIINQRLNSSIAMLNDGLSNEQIAYNLAFCSQSHFIECFKKQYGITPAQYKRSIK